MDDKSIDGPRIVTQSVRTGEDVRIRKSRRRGADFSSDAPKEGGAETGAKGASAQRKQPASSAGRLKLRPKVQIISKQHLMMRWLVMANGCTLQEISRICGKPEDEIRLHFYGKARRAATDEVLAKVAKVKHMQVDVMYLNAQRWNDGLVSESRHSPIAPTVQDITNPEKEYSFRREWLDRKGYQLENLFVIRQDVNLLQVDGVQCGDVFLVDRSRTETMVGKLYAVEVAGKPLVAIGKFHDGRCVLCVDSTGSFYPTMQPGEVKLLGQCVWKGSDIA
ncbi:MAG: hypothetical protein LBR22_05760 [Desulfovibrio sp.]|jgi:hypothetical protein|nr:hypothetical protein [Desulfovibrio sp.]